MPLLMGTKACGWPGELVCKGLLAAALTVDTRAGHRAYARTRSTPRPGDATSQGPPGWPRLVTI